MTSNVGEPAERPRLQTGRALDGGTGGRRMSLDVHGQLRAMILNGELAPGAPLLQAEMARQLGVSRTPMREAFRLLQEEGLIDAKPDQRATVKAVVPQDLDSVYGARIMLETLAVSVTARLLTPADLERMGAAVHRMQELAGGEKSGEWHACHKEFHRIATRGVGEQLQRMLASLAEQSERYIRLGGDGGATGSRARAHQEHEALLAALGAGDSAGSARVLARHLARTALGVLADIAPEHDPAAVRTALAITGAAISASPAA